MKRSIVAFAALMALSSFTSAKISYIDGEVQRINTQDQTISILNEKNGETVTFKVADKASSRLSRLSEGEDVSLKLETVKLNAVEELASLSAPKAQYVDGEVKEIDKASKTISIIKDEDGEAVTYKVDAKTSKKLGRVKEGDTVSLKVTAAK